VRRFQLGRVSISKKDENGELRLISETDGEAIQGGTIILMET